MELTRDPDRSAPGSLPGAFYAAVVRSGGAVTEQTHDARVATLEGRTSHLVTRGDLYHALLTKPS